MAAELGGSLSSSPCWGLPQTQATTDDYYTPAWLFEAMGLTFDLDVSSPPGGVPWIPAARYFTVEDDGLAQPWVGRVWMNPPFSKPDPWVRRFIEHGDGVCLVPMSNGRWFFDLWSAAAAVVLPSPTALKFVGGAGGGIPIRCALAAFGVECVDALRRVGVVRVKDAAA